MTRRELSECIFWLSEGLVLGVPVLMVLGSITLDRELDRAGWFFVDGLLLLPVSSALVWKHDRKMAMAGFGTLAVIGGLALYLVSRYAH